MRRVSAWFLVPIAIAAPPLANALFMFLSPDDRGRLSAWLNTWVVAVLDLGIAFVLARAARSRAVAILCVVLVAAVGAASWLALAVLMMAP